MSTANALFGGPQAGQPANGSATDPAQQNAQQADLNALIEAAMKKSMPQVIDQALEGFSRKQQSQRDQQEARILKRFNETLEVIRAGGTEPTEAQVQAARQRAANAEAQEIAPQSLQQQPGQALPVNQAPDTSWKQALLAEVSELMGISLEANDPEAINFKDSDDVGQLTKNIKAALRGKGERLKAQAAGRAPITGTSSGSPGNLKAQYREELKKVRRGDIDALGRVRQKYREMGLNDFSD